MPRESTAFIGRESPGLTGSTGVFREESRFTEEQIVGVIKESEAGSKTADLCRKHGISPATFYKWKSKFGGMEIGDVAKMRSLEDENRRLKRLLADSALETDALKLIASGNS